MVETAVTICKRDTGAQVFLCILSNDTDQNVDIQLFLYIECLLIWGDRCTIGVGFLRISPLIPHAHDGGYAKIPIEWKVVERPN